MRQAQAVDHLREDLSALGVGVGLFHLRPQFVVDRLPIEAAELGIIVLISNGPPDVLE